MGGSKKYYQKVLNMLGSSLIGYWALDDVSGITAANKAPALSTINLCKNCGFEVAGGGGADVFNSWLEAAAGGTIAATTTAGEFRTGTACKITSAGSISGVSQLITAPAGTVLNISFWCRGDGINAPFYRVAKGDYSGYIIPQTSTGITGTEFVKFDVPAITIPDGQTSIYFYCTTPATDGAFACFDDVTVSPSVIKSSYLDGLYVNTTLGQPGIGGSPSAYFNSNGGVKLDNYNGAVSNAFNGVTGSISIWQKTTLAALTDGVPRWSIKLKTGDIATENYVDIFKYSDANSIGWQYKDDMAVGNFRQTAWTTETWHQMGVTWGSGVAKYYLNGVQVGSNITIDGNWTKQFNYNHLVIGSENNSLSSGGWIGNLAHAFITNTELSPSEMAIVAHT